MAPAGAVIPLLSGVGPLEEFRFDSNSQSWEVSSVGTFVKGQVKRAENFTFLVLGIVVWKGVNLGLIEQILGEQARATAVSVQIRGWCEQYQDTLLGLRARVHQRQMGQGWLPDEGERAFYFSGTDLEIV